VVLVLIWALAAENRVDPVTWLLRRPAFVYLGGLGLNTYLLHYPMKDAIQDWTYPWTYPDGDGEMGHKWLTLSKHGDEWCKTPGKNTERGVETPFEDIKIDGPGILPDIDIKPVVGRTEHPHPNVGFVLYLAVLLAAAAGMHHFIEGPARGVIRAALRPAAEEEEEAKKGSGWMHRPFTLVGSAVFIVLGRDKQTSPAASSTRIFSPCFLS